MYIMNKRMIMAALLAALIVLPTFAFAAAEGNTQQDGFDRMLQRHEQCIQQFVDNGVITADEARQLDEHMQAVAPIMRKIYQNGGMGPGMMGGRGMSDGTGAAGCPHAGNVRNGNAQ